MQPLLLFWFRSFRLCSVPELTRLAAAFAAASGASLIQYFLTGGPVAALATVIPVVPGSNLKQANLFQRPSILFGCLVALIITILLMIF